MTKTTDHRRVTYQGRTYLALVIQGRLTISCEFDRWQGLGVVSHSRLVKRDGPTFNAVRKLTPF